MLSRFPPSLPHPDDRSFLSADADIFAKLKIEPKAGKRTVFMTAHTLIMVISGTKLLHFPDKTLEVSAGNLFLLKKGIYVMAEHLEAGVHFEAIMMFLPDKVLQSFIAGEALAIRAKLTTPYAIFPSNDLVSDFIIQFRQYFEHRSLDYKNLMRIKQLEILTLLSASGHHNKVVSFINSAASKELVDLNLIIQENILQPLTITELAKLCNRSLAAFKRDFKKQFSTSPRSYINKQRLNHALILLQNTDKLISEIAVECAFESPSYFIRIFRQEFGVTPRSIRAKTAIT
jgi:AraC family transcriptional regulator, exoenzyme S synthesis regulatory protein ExsA